ncbi:D-alanine--D-alanine ligase family protein [Anaerocolumna xylanovorans]|uniref:D-alanine--D-alanine ligase n=1 Tax=Anaerocolumna xylanovorans DSM 12503 TaxID=1121345 RepID=A0A1M7YNB7_9FIRM|nr:D-alanine--D-alanine ligase [Anaerocolumna xylanovorans]SHO54105.1 D-alanine-D-alanine ligase [Anaerocolumna xylanovorans DSM 12503]
MKILVLAGGLSPERDVSLSSGSLIANALMVSGHAVALADVYEGIKAGAEELPGLFLTKEDNHRYEYLIPDTVPDLEALVSKNNGRKELIGANILSLCKIADVVFIALHGSMGENGQLQAVLDCHGISYTGTGYTGCLLAMDKDITKRLLCHEGILTAPWITDDAANITPEKIIAAIGFPCVVKPISNGSSIGISFARNAEELSSALTLATEKLSSFGSKKVLVEKLIKGREFSVGILEEKALPVIEIIPKEGFYDYKNKYQQGLTTECCPAVLSEELTKKAQSLALSVHKTLHLGTYSRVDFILSGDGEFFCLEANTLPGMTPVSLLPQEAKADGISYEELCESIAKLAL